MNTVTLDWVQIITLVLSSSLLSSFITALMTKHNNDKNIKIKTITDERKIWRDKIRDLTKEVNNRYYQNNFHDILYIICEFETRLNPKDKEDRKILNILYLLSELQTDNTVLINEFNKRVSFLLKHDWERVKNEVKLFSKKVKRKKYKGIV